MSRTTYDAECSGCKPAMIDVKTGAVMADDAPSMKIVLRVFGSLTLAEKQAWHRFTCQNSRDLRDIQAAKTFTDRAQAALTKARESVS